MSGDGYFISTDRALLNPEAIHRFLQESYWANTRSLETVRRSLEHSVNFGAYVTATREQVGFARVVTDHATFSWICDVVVDPAHRGHGLGKRLMEAIVAHPQISQTKCILG